MGKDKGKGSPKKKQRTYDKVPPLERDLLSIPKGRGEESDMLIEQDNNEQNLLLKQVKKSS
jgi:hypothetical protein